MDRKKALVYPVTEFNGQSAFPAMPGAGKGYAGNRRHWPLKRKPVCIGTDFSSGKHKT